MRHLGPIRQLLIFGCCLIVGLSACTPPTPPPSPTPWPTATPEATAPAAPALSAVTPRAAQSATPRPTLAPETVQLTVWASLSPGQQQTLAEEIQSFQSLAPQYTITLRAYDTPDTFMELPDEAGEFDLVLASPVLLRRLWLADRIAPVADFFPPSFIDEFAATPLNGARQAGQVWGLPDTAGFHLLLFYNQALVESLPADVEELSKLAQDLTQGNQVGLALNSYDPLWLIPWLTPYGGWLTDEAGQPTLDTPAMVAALTMFQSWHQAPRAPVAQLTYEEARSQFRAGQVAMLIDGDWALAELAQTEDLAWGVTLLPSLGPADDSQPAAPLVLARYWAINQATSGDRALAAAAFLEYITSPDRQLAWTKRYGQLPTRREALNDPAIANDPRLRLSATQMLAGQTLPLSVEPNDLLDSMRGPLRSLIDGAMTPAEAAAAMQANLEK